MKKITFYKNTSEYDAHKGGYYAGKEKHGYHFEQGEGYLFECPHGIQVALENVGGWWNVTELTSGNLVTPSCKSRTEAIEKACVAAPAVRKMLDSKHGYLAVNIQALKAYAKQQQSIA